MTSNQVLQDWFEDLPVDVRQRFIDKVFTDMHHPEDLLSAWFDEEEIPLLVKCHIEQVSEQEGYPFSFDDEIVSMMRKVIEKATCDMEDIQPDISHEELMITIQPTITYAWRIFMNFPK